MDRKRLHQVIDKVAEQHPDRIAIAAPEGVMTYDEMRRRTNALAWAMRESGLKQEEVVALMLPPGTGYVMAVLAVMKAGGVFFPLQEAFPDARLKEMLAAVVPKMVVAETNGAKRLFALMASGDGIPPVRVETAEGERDFFLAGNIPFSGSEEPLPDTGTGDDGAYVISTSGSTGTPKAIYGNHKGLSHFIHWEGGAFCEGSVPTVSFLTPPTFDVSLRDIFLPLFSGGTLAIPAPSIVTRPDLLVDWLMRQRVTHTHMVPSVFRLLTEELSGRKEGDGFFPDLQFVLLAGEALYGRDVERWRKLARSKATLVNLYGPSETTLAKICHRIQETETFGPREIVPLGTPISNTAVLILKGNRLCKTGEIGEIVIRTPFMTKGYYGRPDLTEKVFVENPLSDTPERVYRTGDMGRYRPDGSISYAGRRDRQIKVNGIRVEPAEIEAVLQTCCGVGEVLVVPLAKEDAEIKIAAYLTPLSAPEDEILAAHCKKHLPAGMQPAGFLRLDSFPLNFNGKVDVKSLPRLDLKTEEMAVVPPEDALEAEVLDLFINALGGRRIGVEHHFTRAGGNSLAAIRLITELFRRFSVEMPIAAFYEGQTARRVAEFLRKAEKRPENGPVQQEKPEGGWPLSSAQERLWVLDRMEGAGLAWHVPECLLVEGPLDADALEAAFSGLLARHDALRTVFPEGPDGPVQEQGASDFVLERVDLSVGRDPGASLDAALKARMGMPFCVAKGPLFRATLFTLAPSSHALFIDFHHMIADGTSMPQLTAELGLLYRIYQGEEVVLPPLPAFGYRDYALWQQSFLTTRAAASLGGYWQEKLKGDLPVLRLPVDQKETARAGFRGGRATLTLDAGIADAMNAAMERAGVTAFVWCTALVKLLLFRYTGQTDFAIGAPVTERPHPALRGVVGFFVNPLPLRDEIFGNQSFGTLLSSVEKTVTEAVSHGAYPFDRIVTDLGIDRKKVRYPLFNTMVVVQDAARTEGLFPHCRLQFHDMATETTRYDLAFAFTPAADKNGWRVEVTYDRDLFFAETIKGMLSHLRMLLLGVLKTPDLPLLALDFLLPEEKESLLRMEAGPVRAMAETSLGETFVTVARRFASRPAIREENGGIITYDALCQTALRIAAGIRREGVASGSVISVYQKRSGIGVASLMGVLAAGCVYLPVDPATTPEARLKEILAAAGCPLVLATENGEDPRIRDVADVMAAKPLEGAISRMPQDPAYLMFTSGSTGIPKGVLVPHEGFLRMLFDQMERFGITEHDTLSHFLSPAFDAGLFEICLALFSGATASVFAPHELEDPAAFVKRLRKEEVTVLNTTPSWLSAIGMPDLPALRLVISGGEKPKAEDMKQYLAAGKWWANCYGPTETSVCASYHLYRSLTDLSREVGIGRPVAGSRIRIVDGGGRAVPVGVSGEIVVAGPGLALGYWQDPSRTEKRFGKDPETGQRVYHTGDRGRWTTAGELIFEGRMDAEVKCRGVRIHPEEVRSALMAQFGVRDAAVAVRKDQLVAWIVRDSVEDDRKIRRRLQEILPGYLVPDILCPVDGIPVTQNGKADVTALPDPAGEGVSGALAMGETELALIWQEVTGHLPPSAGADFFAHGGNSLAAARLSTRVRERWGVDLSLKAIFAAPVLREMVASIEQARSRILPPLQAATGRDAGRLSDAERRIWVMEHLQSHAASAYVMHGGFLVEGPLDVAAMEMAVSALVRRHPMLRAVYREQEGGPVRETLPVSSVSPGVRTTEKAVGQTVSALSAAIRNTPMSLAEGPLFSCVLKEMENGDHGLFLTLHHIIADGWSMGILEGDLHRLYLRCAKGEKPDLPPLPWTYGDAVLWLETRMATEKESRNYWLSRFATPPEPLSLLSDCKRPKVQSFAGNVVKWKLSDPATRAVETLGRRTGLTPFMTLLGLSKILFHRLSGAEDIVVGTPVAGRSHPAFESIVGCFVNTLALRTEIMGDHSTLSVMEAVRDTVLEGLRHESYPFDRLVEEVGGERDTGRSPLFDVMVALEEKEDAFTWGDLTFTDQSADPGFSKYDLTFFFRKTNGEMTLVIEYATALFTAETIRKLARRFSVLAVAAAKDPEAAIGDLPLMDAMEAREIARFQEADPADRIPPAGNTVVDLFLRQVAKRPAATAVICDRVRLSYEELEYKSRVLAGRIRDAGGSKGSMVAVLASPTEKMAITVLAIVRAGAAYVPLDPDWPVERIRDILTDTGCRVGVCDGIHMATLEEWGLASVLSCDGPTEPGPMLPLDRPAADDLAYIMYTSGSTGRPKGVEIPHRAILGLIRANNFLQPTRQFRMLQTGALAFDASTYEIWGMLANGGTLVMAGSENVGDPAVLASLVKRHRVSTLFMTTSYFNQVVDAPYPVFDGLQHLMTGGEHASLPHFCKVRRKWPKLHLVHVYGPTENTTFSTYHTVCEKTPGELPIGRPVTGTSVRILDRRGQVVPGMVAGEICLGGDGLANGYRNRPEETKKRFGQIPESGTERLYHTGDLGFWGADGAIRFLGRMDDQLKVRGFRVEPGEVAAALLQHPEMEQCVVVGRKVTGTTMELVAYFQSRIPLSIDALRSFAGERLPAFMIPSWFVAMEAFPLNRNGKVDRAALPDPRSAGMVPAPSDDRPFGERETLLCGIWETVLGRKGIGRSDNFFTLGGDSIKAIRIMALLREAGWALSVRALFATPEIRGLSEQLQPVAAGERWEGEEGGMTPIQHWFFSLYPQKPSRFHQSLTLQLSGNEKPEVIGAAVAALWKTHEALRSVFREEDGQMVRAVLPETTEAPFAVVDLERAADPASEIKADLFAREGNVLLEKGPLWQPVLYKMPGEPLLVLSCHHLVTDGVSWRILLEDLHLAWEMAEKGEPVVLADPVTTFSSWCGFLAKRAQTLPRSVSDYWGGMKTDGGFLSPDLPFSSGSGRFRDRREMGFVLDQEVSFDLTASAHAAFRTRTDELLVTGLVMALTDWSGVGRHTIAFESLGREAGENGPDLSRTVGWLTALYPLTLTLPEGTRDLPLWVRNIRQQLRAVPDRGLDWGVSRYLSGSAGNEGMPPEVGFNYMGEVGSGKTGRFQVMADPLVPFADPDLPLCREMDISGSLQEGRLVMQIAWNAKKFSKERIRALCDGLKAALLALRDAAIGAQGDLTVSDIDYKGLDQSGLDSLLDGLETDSAPERD